MGYFSNGSEGEGYEAEYCDRCIHQKPDDGGCAVWFAHLMHNSDQNSNEQLENALNILIPRRGICNEQCTMFIEEPVQCQTP